MTNLEGVDLILTDRMRARAGLARREYLMYVIRADGEVFAARTAKPKRLLHEQNRLLNALVDTYKDRCRLHRVMTEELEEVRTSVSGNRWAGHLSPVRYVGGAGAGGRGRAAAGRIDPPLDPGPGAQAELPLERPEIYREPGREESPAAPLAGSRSLRPKKCASTARPTFLFDE